MYKGPLATGVFTLS